MKIFDISKSHSINFTGHLNCVCFRICGYPDLGCILQGIISFKKAPFICGANIYFRAVQGCSMMIIDRWAESKQDNAITRIRCWFGLS